MFDSFILLKKLKAKIEKKLQEKSFKNDLFVYLILF